MYLKPIKLRGPHVNNLGVYFFLFYDAEKRKPRAPKGYREVFNLPTREKRPFIQNELFYDIIRNPELKIEPVDTLDIVCMGDQNHLPCLKRKPEDRCELDENGVDKKYLAEYSLVDGQIITSEELLKRIVEFKKRTGFVSPRVRDNALLF